MSVPRWLRYADSRDGLGGMPDGSPAHICGGPPKYLRQKSLNAVPGFRAAVLPPHVTKWIDLDQSPKPLRNSKAANGMERARTTNKETPTEIGASRYCWQLALNTDPPVTKRCEEWSGQQQRLMTYGESGNFGKVDNQNGPKFAAIEGYQTGSPASFCFRCSSASRLIICCRSDSSVTRSSRRR